MGVATRFVERVCLDADADGFDFVEAYTYRELKSDGFRGPLALYQKCGFDIIAETEGRVVVRKKLK
jgi:hypothetical protein